MAYNDQMTKTQTVNLVNDWLAAHAPSVTVGLFTNDVLPNANSISADFIEPTGSWYTPIGGTYGQPFDAGNDTIGILMHSVEFNYTGTDPSETIHGYTVNLASDGTLLHANTLPTPVVMADTLDNVNVQPGFSVSVPALS